MSDYQTLKNKFEEDYAAGEFARDQANEDMRFVMIPGGMWEGFLDDGYANRPKMEYDMVEGQIHGYMGEWSANELAPKFRSDSGNDADAESVDGVFRGVWRDNGGSISMKNAVLEHAICGFGAVRMNTKYLDDVDVEDDRQDICYTSIYGAYSSVVFDANAKEQDKSDAKCVFIIQEFTHEAFKEKWPEHEVATATGRDDRREFNWNTRKSVFVIEAYEVVEKVVRVSVYVNAKGNKVFVTDAELRDDDLAQELVLGGYRKTRSKKVKRRHVEKSILGANDYIEKPRKIHGDILPVFPVYMNRSIVDGQEIYHGFVRKQKDPQRVLNMQVSNLAEIAATSIKQTPIFAPEQVAGLQRRWAEAHLSKKNFQLCKPLYNNKTGDVIAAGPVGTLNPPAIDPATQGLIEFSTQHIQSTTQGQPQDVVDPKTSGKAILAVQNRADRQTYSAMDDIAIAIKRIGEGFASAAKDIFIDGRTMNSIAQDGSESQVQLQRQELDEDGFIRTTNVFKQNKFKVYTQVGPSYESKRRETIEFMKEIVSILPENDGRQDAIISSIIDNMQGVGLDAIKEMNRKRMLASGLIEPKTDEDKETLAQLAQEAQQPDPTNELLLSQANLNNAKAESEQVDNVKRLTDADLNKAKTAEIMNDINMSKAQALLGALAR